MLRTQKNKKAESVSLSIFCPRSRNKHALRECPLENIKICVICEETHAKKYCPSTPGLKDFYQEEVGTSQTPK